MCQVSTYKQNQQNPTDGALPADCLLHMASGHVHLGNLSFSMGHHWPPSAQDVQLPTEELHRTAFPLEAPFFFSHMAGFGSEIEGEFHVKDSQPSLKTRSSRVQV